jgi:hypothetical protein
MSCEEKARMSDSVWVQVGRAHPSSLPAAVDATYTRLREVASTSTASQNIFG